MFGEFLVFVAAANLRIEFVTPSKPGALGGPCSDAKTSLHVIGAVRGFQTERFIFLAFHL